jgi:hypothetical protein
MTAELDWSLDDDGTQFANGEHLGFEIDLDNELAVFEDDKCVAIRKAVDIDHAEYLANAFERTAAFYKQLESEGKPQPRRVW